MYSQAKKNTAQVIVLEKYKINDEKPTPVLRNYIINLPFSRRQST
jgi:hypothetical protein